MDASELLQKGNLMVIQVVEGFPETGSDMPGARGDWSVKDIIAHLSSYEHVTIEILKTFQGEEPTSLILQFLHHLDEFNNAEVEARAYLTAQQIIDEYQDTHVQTTSLLMQIPPDRYDKQERCPDIARIIIWLISSIASMSTHVSIAHKLLHSVRKSCLKSETMQLHHEYMCSIQ